jgi:hypothetical protein
MLIPWWRLIASGAVVTVLVSSCVVRDRNLEQRGAAKVTSELARQTEQINAKARKARAAARAPGSVERVRKDYCRDC